MARSVACWYAAPAKSPSPHEIGRRRATFPAVKDLPATADDAAAVARLLGREPQGAFAVVVRHADGQPLVIRNAPFLDDGRPMPTRYWLVGEPERTQVSRLESSGAVAEAERCVGLPAVAEAHIRYAAERDSAVPPGHVGPRPSGGVGGTRRGVKCLHAHYAWHLAGGDDPVGRWVAARLAEGAANHPGKRSTTPGVPVPLPVPVSERTSDHELA